MYSLRPSFLTLLPQFGHPDITQCSHYPTEEFSAYYQCDNKFISSLLSEYDISPMWSQDNTSDVTVLKTLGENEGISYRGNASVLYTGN